MFSSDITYGFFLYIKGLCSCSQVILHAGFLYIRGLFVHVLKWYYHFDVERRVPPSQWIISASRCDGRCPNYRVGVANELTKHYFRYDRQKYRKVWTKNKTRIKKFRNKNNFQYKFSEIIFYYHRYSFNTSTWDIEEPGLLYDAGKGKGKGRRLRDIAL
jgi:hypothetical protein